MFSRNVINMQNTFEISFEYEYQEIKGKENGNEYVYGCIYVPYFFNLVFAKSILLSI